MIFLKKASFKKTLFPFKQGFEIEFSGSLVFLTGKQGSGKSTLLNLLSGRDKRRREYLEIKTQSEGMVYFLDSEHDNPRLDANSSFDLANIAMGIRAKGQSHGEAIFEHEHGLLKACLAGEDNAVVLLDEPESGLSLESVEKLKKAMLKLSQKGQIIAATHHPLLLCMPDAFVYDMGARKWIDGAGLVRKYLADL